MVTGGGTGGLTPNQLVALVEDLRPTTASPSRNPTSDAAGPLPGTRWRTTLPSIMALCNVDNKEELPPIYMELARGNKREDRTTIQWMFSQRAQDLGVAAPICTPALCQSIVTCNLAAADDDQLGEGLDPFSTPYRSARQRQEAETVAQLADSVVAGDSTITLSDARNLHQDGKVLIPTDLMQVGTGLRMFSIMIDVVLGGRHPFLQAVQKFLRKWSFREPMLVEVASCPSPAGTVALPMALLRAIQKRSHGYFRRFMESGRLPPAAPRFTDVLVALENDEWHRPHMPDRFLHSITPGTSIATKPLTSAVTPVSSAAQVMAPANIKRTDLKFDAATETLAAMQRRLGPAPQDKNETEICLCYLLAGMCRKICPRAANHRLQSKEEQEALTWWYQASE